MGPFDYDHRGRAWNQDGTTRREGQSLPAGRVPAGSATCLLTMGLERLGMELALRVAGVLMGVAGALVATVFMLLGPWITTPGPEGIHLATSLGYPLSMFLAGVAIAVRPRVALGLAIIALACAVYTLAPDLADGSVPPFEATMFGLLICSPALVLGAVALVAVRVVSPSPRGR